jgi:hypothetical protein
MPEVQVFCILTMLVAVCLFGALLGELQVPSPSPTIPHLSPDTILICFRSTIDISQSYSLIPSIPSELVT